jgi:hypothetical protein
MNLLKNAMNFTAFSCFRTEQETECQTVNDREDFMKTLTTVFYF